MAKAAEVLDKKEDAERYGKLAGEICDAFVKEYFTPAGRLAVDTMTAYVVVLYMGTDAGFRIRKGVQRASEQAEKEFLSSGYGICRNTLSMPCIV